MSDTEPRIIKEFRELYDYVRLMGDHVNQIYNRLDGIERNIDEVTVSHRNSITANKAEITNMRESMVNKYEFTDFVEKLKASIGEKLPPLPTLGKLPAIETSQNTGED